MVLLTTEPALPAGDALLVLRQGSYCVAQTDQERAPNSQICLPPVDPLSELRPHFQLFSLLISYCKCFRKSCVLFVLPKKQVPLLRNSYTATYRLAFPLLERCCEDSPYCSLAALGVG